MSLRGLAKIPRLENPPNRYRWTKVCGALVVKSCINRAALPEALASDRHRELVAPDGAWFRFVQRHCAERDGDVELAAALLF
jgi:hypothetical protein